MSNRKLYFGALLALMLFFAIYKAKQFPYTYITMEGDDFWVLTRGFWHLKLAMPPALTNWLADFLMQFYSSPYIAASIEALILGLIGVLAYAALSPLLGKGWRRLLALLPPLLLGFYCTFSLSFLLQWVLFFALLLIYQKTLSNSPLKGENTGKEASPLRGGLVGSLKAVKNAAEIEGFRRAMLRDGIAMVKFLHWLKPAVEAGNETEMSIDRKLTALRAEQPLYRGLSFDTIAAYGPHGAIVHYEATPDTDIKLEPKGLLLLDSGAQYQDGTTDITRTIALGPLTDEERHDYTLVLKGHIRLALTRFPDGISGTQIDALARYAMWQHGINYGHGTGHGIGSYLCVHEGPHQIRHTWKPAPLHACMTVTNEPGIYRAGKHGARIENTMLIVEDGETEFGKFLRLEPLTLCPIDLTPVLWDMMTQEEVDYINNYHKKVYEALAPLLNEEEKQWLNGQCSIR